VPKHVGICTCYEVYFISAIVGGYMDCNNMHGMNNINCICKFIMKYFLKYSVMNNNYSIFNCMFNLI